MATTSDYDLVANFARLYEHETMFFLEIAVVGWNGHSPYLKWTPFRGWASAPTLSQHLQALGEALEDERFFCRCTWCGRRTNDGHMSGIRVEEDLECVRVCQSCAERFFGVVY